MEWFRSISSIGDLHMITEYCIRASNSLNNEFTIANENLHDAEASVRSFNQEIKRTFIR